MLGYEDKEDTDTHLSSSHKDASVPREEEGLSSALYALPHRNQVRPAIPLHLDINPRCVSIALVRTFLFLFCFE